MAIAKDFVDYLNNNEFSIEMLDRCREHFQYGFDDDEAVVFRNIMIEKLQQFFPGLPHSIGNVFAQLCIDRGVLTVNDIFFIDDAIFVEKEDNFSPIRNGVKYIDFIGSLSNFKCSSSCDFIDAFYNSRVNNEESKKFARELYNIFEQYYNRPFPEVLEYGEDGVFYIKFAINCEEEEIAKSCQEKKSINFKIAGPIRDTNEFRLLELAFSPEKEVLLEVLNCNDNFIKLSDIIEKRKHCQQRILYKKSEDNFSS